MMKIYIASDHAGFDLKEKIKDYFIKKKYDFEDVGPKVYNSEDDFNDFAKKLVKKVKSIQNSKGILVCGSGQGMTIQANRYLGIRCALCWNKEISKQAKEHLNANVLSLPGKHINIRTTKEIIDVWLKTKTITKKKYLDRIKKLERR